MQQKVFVIGFQKTGTMTMATALTQLGYSVCHKNLWWKTDPDITHEKMQRQALDAIKDSDAFVNNPWPLFYKEIDKACPDARFILTERPGASWIESARSHFTGVRRPELKWIYGVDSFDGNEDVFIERYNRHNREVRDYFKDRPGKLLILDLTADPSWKKLCDFLGKPVPDQAFPHSNKTGSLRQQFQRAAVPAIARVRAWMGQLFAPSEPA